MMVEFVLDSAALMPGTAATRKRPNDAQRCGATRFETLRGSAVDSRVFIAQLWRNT